jgi:hypothetical protein
MIFTRFKRSFDCMLWSDHWDGGSWERGGFYYTHCFVNEAGNYHPFCFAKESKSLDWFCVPYWGHWAFNNPEMGMYGTTRSKNFGFQV